MAWMPVRDGEAYTCIVTAFNTMWSVVEEGLHVEFNDDNTLSEKGIAF